MPKTFQLSEMMQHYLKIKENNKDCFVFYRLGDFYEMFFDDAIIASKILDITLTGRDCGLENRAPMCGVPYHSVDSYINKIVKQGHKVAICEQISLPGEKKGLIDRDIVRIITPGTITSDESLSSSENNYLLAFHFLKDSFSFAWADISTGEVFCKEEPFLEENQIYDLLLSIKPSEIIANKGGYEFLMASDYIKNDTLPRPQDFYEYSFSQDNAIDSITKFYSVNNISALGLTHNNSGIGALGALTKYISITQKIDLKHFSSPKIIRNNAYMYLDFTTTRNLELLENLYDRSKKGSLLGVIDNTVTSMGARLLKHLLIQPFNSIGEINLRLDAIEELLTTPNYLKELIDILSKIRDIERLCNKISYNTINPKEILNILTSLKQISLTKEFIHRYKSGLIKSLYEKLNPIQEMIILIDNAINENPPISTKEGGIIKDGFNKDLDELRAAQHNSKKWLTEYELKERNETDLKTLKIGYNRVFGYYLEVSNSYLTKVPDRYIRKQTLSTGERFITEELKIMEEKILGSYEKSIFLEEKLYSIIKSELKENISTILDNAKTIAVLDVLTSLSNLAYANNYSRPIMHNTSDLKIINGRHPVIENIHRNNEFIPNDVLFNNDIKTLIITGPNMAGKSTYMRQIALIVILAHIGSFVPCEKALIPIVDRVFARVGASDNLAYGQSTFMVEMSEVSNIINNATEKSLVLFDEIGRGTSTIDGLAIAWAICEYVTLKIKCKSLFATHYHELSELENIIPEIKNFHVLIKDVDGKIVFLYKIARGGANKSFGVEVASLAGIHKDIINRAKNILYSLEEQHDFIGLKDRITANPTNASIPTTQIGFFESDSKYSELCKILDDINIDNCTPIESLTILSNLKKMTNKNRKNRK